MAGRRDESDGVVTLIRDVLRKRDQTLHAVLLILCVAIAIATAGPALALLLLAGSPHAAAVVGALSTVSAGVAARKALLNRRPTEEPPQEE
jgi:putative exporter of polyketide antibiotics